MKLARENRVARQHESRSKQNIARALLSRAAGIFAPRHCAPARRPLLEALESRTLFDSTLSSFTYADFTSTTGLAVTGTASQVATTDGNVLRMTTTVGGTGWAYTTQQANVATFITSFDYRLSSPGGTPDINGHVGGDGFVFALQTSSPNAIGTGGGLFGIGGLTPSVAVEFDTWEDDPTNFPTINDASSNHIGICVNGSAQSVATANIATPLDNGALWHALISYDGTSLKVWTSTTAIDPNSAANLCYKIDIVSDLASSSAYAGFAASTGSTYQNQDILTWTYSGAAAGATFLKSDATTQGTWQTNYGADGYDISQGASTLPSYATLALSGSSDYTWASNNGDARNLANATNGTIAGTWYSSSSFTVDLNLTDGNAHQVSFYLLDWDNRGRAEQIQVLDATTNAVLDTQTVGSFAGGKYLSWNLVGHVKLNFIDTAGPNAVISGIFFGPGAATFAGTDSTTKGNWQTQYGADGYDISQMSANIPSYATVAISGNANYMWASNANDPRDLATPGGGTIAGVWYAANSFTVDLNLTDSKTHQVSFYMLDWENRSRTTQVQITNAATGLALNSQTLSNFSGGDYLTWNLSGHVILTFTNIAGPNAVLSGIFFGKASATNLGVDSHTQGNWQSVYGSDGYNTSQGAAIVPSYVSMSFSGINNYTWATNDGDPRGLIQPTGGTVSGVWYAPTMFSIDLNLTDGQSHEVSLYMLDWDNRGRGTQVQIINAATGMLIGSQTVSSYAGGKYLNWNLSGHVELVFTNLAGPNATLSGILFGQPTAANLGTDAVTQGNWQGNYGTDGYNISQGPASLPSYATMSLSSNSSYTWAQNNGDPRNLTNPTGGSLAGVWYSATSFTIDLNLTDGNAHRVSLYLLDWDNRNRDTMVTVKDATTGQTISSQSITNFASGKYVNLMLSGHVQITLSNMAGPNAVLSGIFFGV